MPEMSFKSSGLAGFFTFGGRASLGFAAADFGAGFPALGLVVDFLFDETAATVAALAATEPVTAAVLFLEAVFLTAAFLATFLSDVFFLAKDNHRFHRIQNVLRQVTFYFMPISKLSHWWHFALT